MDRFDNIKVNRQLSLEEVMMIDFFRSSKTFYDMLTLATTHDFEILDMS